MIWIVSGEPGGEQKKWINQAAKKPGTLWIAIDQDPDPDVPCEWWDNLPWQALVAGAARLGRPFVEKDQLVVSTLEGFKGPAQRLVRAADHTEQTKRVAQAVVNGGPIPKQIIVAGISTMYERALALVGSTVPSSDLENASKLVPAFAGSALTHFTLDLSRSGIPTLMSAYNAPNGKKTSPYIPRGVSHIVDRVTQEFDLEEWMNQ